MAWEIVAVIAIVIAVWFWIKLQAEKAMPKDIKRRVFTRDEVIKTAWQHYDKCGPKCGHCGGDEDLDVDHIIPLSKPGGHNGLNNLQILCSRCNSRKGNRHSG